MVYQRTFHYQETRGIRVTAQPFYLPDYSVPGLNKYFFSYFIRIENASHRTVRLLSRRWYIYDSSGENQEVQSDDAPGQNPLLPDGSIHEYQSFCMLRSPQGYMEGAYRLIGLDDIIIEAAIPRLHLDAAAL